MEINIEEYYQKYGPMVFRRCNYLLKNEERALDAMQDVFVRLLENKNRLKGTYPSSLLYTIATNICLNIIRADKNKVVYNDDVLHAIASYDNSEDKIINLDLLDQIFQKEKESTREIAVMHFIDKMTLQEVADSVGMSISGIRKRLRKLKERVSGLKELYYEEK